MAFRIRVALTACFIDYVFCLQHGHQSNPVVHTWGGKHKNKNAHESEWKWMEEIKAVRSNLSTFGSNRVNMLLGFGKRLDYICILLRGPIFIAKRAPN